MEGGKAGLWGKEEDAAQYVGDGDRRAGQSGYWAAGEGQWALI